MLLLDQRYALFAATIRTLPVRAGRGRARFILKESLPALPADEREDALKGLEEVGTQAVPEKPKRKWFVVGAESLLKAASAVGSAGGELIQLVEKLRLLVFPS